MTFESVPYEPAGQDPTDFSSGESSLDHWLAEHAAAETKRGSARVWVWLDDANRVVGYYSLSASKVRREEVPKAFGRGGPQEIAAVLIGRLALDRSLRGQGLGPLLLADALTRILQATLTVGARLVVVNALREPAALFYERVGFRRIPGSLLLVQMVADIRAAYLVAQDPL